MLKNVLIPVMTSFDILLIALNILLNQLITLSSQLVLSLGVLGSFPVVFPPLVVLPVLSLVLPPPPVVEVLEKPHCYFHLIYRDYK